jgi:DNA-binding GntR family transcriptional regulator
VEGKLRADEIVFRYVISKLVSRELHPGERVYEPALCRELGVSRTPVRQAISRLISEGVLENCEGQKGYSVPILTPEDMFKVYSTREMVEAKCAYYAALNASDEDVALLWNMNRQEHLLYETDDKERFATLNEKFHITISTLSKNIYLQRFAVQLYWRAQLYTFYLGSFYRYYRSLAERKSHPRDPEHHTNKEHARVISAIQNRCPDEAHQAMAEHIRRTYEHFCRIEKSNNF